MNDQDSGFVCTECGKSLTEAEHAYGHDCEPIVEWSITQKKFRHKETGKIVTQVPILQMNEYEEV